MLSELCRLGADVELRFTPAGDPVAELSLAYDVRIKGESRTQWIKASLWGKRAESLTPHLTKGTQLFVVTESPYVRKWDNGDGYTVMAKIIDIKFAGGKVSNDQQGEQPLEPDYRGHRGSNQANPTYAPASPPPVAGGFDDDIPFAPLGREYIA